jgi:lipopolysaccharide export system permease protein
MRRVDAAADTAAVRTTRIVMLRIIDRYLLRQFIKNFLICFISLTGLYIVFDAFTNLDEFLAYSEKQGNLASIMFEYYSYKSIYFFDRTSGILALIAAMFTVTWIQRYNELTALMAAGVSKGRVVLPVIVAAIVVAVLAAANREAVIPRLREGLSRNLKDLAGENAQEVRPRYDNETDILLRGKNSYAKEQRIHSPNFLLPPEMGRIGRQLVAAEAYYHKPTASRPGGYLLKGVERPKDIAKMPSFVRGNRRIIITPRDEPAWLEPNQCFVATDIDFEALTGGTGWKQFSSTPALVRGLANRSLDFGADVRVAIHARLVQPFMDVTLLFLGMPLVLGRNNRNIFASVGLCLLAVCVFMLTAIASQFLGTNVLIEPDLAAWLPLFLFVPVALGMSDPLLE